MTEADGQEGTSARYQVTRLLQEGDSGAEAGRRRASVPGSEDQGKGVRGRGRWAGAQQQVMGELQEVSQLPAGPWSTVCTTPRSLGSPLKGRNLNV